MTYPGVLFWIAVIWAAAARGPALYYVFFACWSLGTLAVVPAASLGNFTPPWIAACFLTASVILTEGPRRYFAALIDLRRFGFLGLCTLYAAASAYFLPRLFEGRITVITMRPTEVNGAIPLRPDMANISQGVYFIITTLTVVSIYFICQDENKRTHFLRAFAWGAVVAVGTGVLDLLTSLTGLGGLLAPFRNANYAMLLDNDAVGMHRVVGLMSEASSYAGLCIPFLCLLALTPSKDSLWGRWRAPLCVALAMMTYLSTSSGGYLALGALAAILAVSIAVGILEKRKAAWWGAYGVMLVGVILALAVLFKPDVLDPIGRVIDGVVFKKTSGESYVTRAAWNRISYQAFLESHLFGVGIGGARASSWIYSLLSNIGAPGTALLLVFMLQVWLTPANNPGDRTFARAVKFSLAPSLLLGTLAGTTAGFGLGGATFFGLASALCWPAAAPSTSGEAPALRWAGPTRQGAS
ncbi:MAG: hypothetical protein JWQ97_2009 [Phenylobacterium sp.]|nr:hypothetical protein [Phenylobacterium sp.]